MKFPRKFLKDKKKYFSKLDTNKYNGSKKLLKQ